MSSEAKEPREKLSPIVVVALIGLVGTIIAVRLGSPLLSRDCSDRQSWQQSGSWHADDHH